MQSKRAIWQSRILDGATVALLISAGVLFFNARRSDTYLVPAAVPLTLERDSRVPTVEIMDDSGTRATLLRNEGKAGHLILFFRSDCPVCAQQRPSWAELAALVQASGWVVTGVTTEPLTEMAKGYLGAGFRVVQMDTRTAERLRTTVVPTTLAVGAGSNVLLHHAGLLSFAAADSIKSFF